jgi:hypothetical protein
MSGFKRHRFLVEIILVPRRHLSIRPITRTDDRMGPLRRKIAASQRAVDLEPRSNSRSSGRERRVQFRRAAQFVEGSTPASQLRDKVDRTTVQVYRN